MTFIKKHYEKVLLSIVLLGLAVAAAALPLQVARVRTFIDETVISLPRTTTPKPFKPLDEYLTTNEVVVKRFEGPVEFDFSAPHNLFNPVIWKKGRSGRLEKFATGTEIGPGALVVTNITELRLTVEFEKPEAVGSVGDNYRYHFTVTRDTDSNPKRPQTATRGIPNTLFLLTKVDGPPNQPTALHLQFKDEKQEIVVGKDKPFVRVIGYAADLKYPRDTRPYLRKRVKDVLTLRDDPEKYKIVAITTNEVVLSAESTQKRTTLRLNAPPD